MNTKKMYLVNLMFSLLPPSRMYPFKSALLRWAGAKLGKNVRIVSTARIQMTGDLSIGDNTYIGDYALITGGDAGIKIGRDVAIGPRCLLVTGTHEKYTHPDIAAGNGYSLPIEIGSGVWLGANVTVLGGVVINEGAIAAAGALVRCDVGRKEMVAGVPARTIGGKQNAQ